MKKALVVLLLLAFTAGGLFAQFSFSGLIHAGFGGVIVGDNEPAFGMIRRASGGDGMRAQLAATFTNEEKTAGISMALRANGGGADGVITPGFQWAYGWVSGLDGMLTAMGGRFFGWEFDPYDAQAAWVGGWANGHAIVGAIKPIDMLSIAYGVVGKNAGLSLSRPGEWGVINLVGVGVRVPDVLDVNIASRIGFKLTDIYASFRVTALDNIGIKLTAVAMNLHDFSDAGYMSLYEEVNLNGLVDNLSINLLFLQSIAQKEAAAAVSGTTTIAPKDKDLVFRGWAWASYAIGNIVPRLDVSYVTGTRYSFNRGLNDLASVFRDGAYHGYDYNANYSYMTVGLSCQFRVAGNRYFEVGYILGADLGKTGYNSFGGNNDMAHMFHLGVTTVF